MAAVGLEQLRAEAVPLFLHLTEKDPVSGVPAYLPLLEDLLPMLPSELADRSQGPQTLDPDAEAAKRLFAADRHSTQKSIPELTALREKMIPRAAAFVPPVLPEPPALESPRRGPRTGPSRRRRRGLDADRSRFAAVALRLSDARRPGRPARRSGAEDPAHAVAIPTDRADTPRRHGF